MPSRDMTPHISRVSMDSRRSGAWTATIAMLTVLAGCATAVPVISPPRPIVIHSGARLRVDYERMKAVNEWVTREQKNIVEDPSFLVETRLSVDDVYVWDQLEIEGDTVRTPVNAAAADSRLVHEIYAHLHMMVDMGRQDEWLPEAPDAVEYELERAILERISDAWLLGRTVFDVTPYGPLDELMYANEAGFLDAFVFTARPSEFALARTEWARANPGETDRYRDWFLQTFNRDPPGLRSR
jgi:hypothetical protein